MFFFCIGLPSRFGEWCQAVTIRLLEHTFGTAAGMYADTLEQFIPQAIGAESPYIVVNSHELVGQLWAALVAASRRFVLVLDDPRVAVENFVVQHGIDFLEATRVVAKSCASVLSCASLPAALVLDPWQNRSDPVVIAAAIAGHFGLPVGVADMAEMLGPLAEVDLQPDWEEHRSWWQQLDDSQRALVTGSVDSYIARFKGNDLGPITWGREFFFINEDPPVEPNPPASRPIDITGRPRDVLHGPYITLPPGSWSADIALGFSEEAAELTYLASIRTETAVLAQTTLAPDGQRVLETNLSFSIEQPIEVGIYISNERAAFDGRLALGHVIMTPVGNLRPETKSYLATAIGA